MEPSRTHRPGRLARMTRLALDLGISSLAYYGCALAGIDTLPALLTAAGVAAAWLAATTLYDRRADGLAIGMLLMYALSAAVAAATSEPRLLLLRDPLVSALAGLVFLGGCLSGTPATAYLARRLHRPPARRPFPPPRAPDADPGSGHRAHCRSTRARPARVRTSGPDSRRDHASAGSRGAHPARRMGPSGSAGRWWPDPPLRQPGP